METEKEIWYDTGSWSSLVLYNAIFESFKELEYRFDNLVKLLNCMTEKMVSYRVIESDIEEIQREYPKI